MDRPCLRSEQNSTNICMILNIKWYLRGEQTCLGSCESNVHKEYARHKSPTIDASISMYV